MNVVGIGGGRRSGAAAVVKAGQLVGVCAQERVTRARDAGVNASGLPDEALDLLLQRLGLSRGSVDRWMAADGDGGGAPATFERVDHHFAHAATAYLTSPFSSSAVVVCDHDAPEVSVWTGDGAVVQRVPWSWTGPGFARLLSICGAALGLNPVDADRRLAALAQLQPSSRDARVNPLIGRDADGLAVAADLEQQVRAIAAAESAGKVPAALAAALQARITDLLVEFLSEVRVRTGLPRLCLGGSLFYNSSVNTRVKLSGHFSDVFVPPDPGDGGNAVGAALSASATRIDSASPFLGPAYSAQETKEVLDNCKLQYEWVSEEGAVAAALKGIEQGHLVGWFQGPMEWGPRALGARSILANPQAPYVLENLNRFLKQRESWRGYAVSGLQEAVSAHFDGPTEAPFMECEYLPRNPATFRPLLPAPGAALRVHTVSPAAHPMFRRLLEAVGHSTGVPFLVNTSFNGFHEPIVCSPRDAIRVFYGSGLDLLVLDQFIIRK
jgi:carbamoyltransferase